MYPQPNAAHTADLALLEPTIALWAPKLQLTYRFMVAHCYQESQWTLHSYRYEPNYDRHYISSTVPAVPSVPAPAERWSKDPAWLTSGPTCGAWFTTHIARAAELHPGAVYSFVAQTRIAASYGPYQIMYPGAVGLGYVGSPEGLQTTEGMQWPLTLLNNLLTKARDQYDDPDAIKVALAQYNGGPVGNTDPDNLRQIAYVQLVEKRYRAFWGQAFFADLDV